MGLVEQRAFFFVIKKEYPYSMPNNDPILPDIMSQKKLMITYRAAESIFLIPLCFQYEAIIDCEPEMTTKP